MKQSDQTLEHRKRAEGGWALLGVLLALSIIAIMMLRVVPSAQMQVRREKEMEMLYRGQQVAEAIARYYNFGRPGRTPAIPPAGQWPPYGPLMELEKLSEGVLVGTNELRFVRQSALIDPMTNGEWDPVRIRDPRLAPALDAYRLADLGPIPAHYMLFALAPVKIQLPDGEGGPEVPGLPANPGSGSGRGQGGSGRTPQDPDSQGGSDPDPDDADDDDDPLSTLIDRSQGNLPIIGIASRAKGASIKSLWGLKSYDEWVFIHIPKIQGIQVPPGQMRQPPQQRSF